MTCAVDRCSGFTIKTVVIAFVKYPLSGTTEEICDHHDNSFGSDPTAVLEPNLRDIRHHCVETPN